MMYEIVLNGYTAQHSSNRCLSLGTAESYGIEKIHITAGPGWEDMLIKAVFHPPSGEAVTALIGEDGIIEVPPEATAVSAGEYNPGVIVFSGVADGVQRISANLAYTVIGHAPVEGKDSTPTPSQWEQLAAQYQSKVDKQQGSENAGKVLGIGEDGLVMPVEQTGGGGIGNNGATFTPNVSEDGVISWTNDGELPNPDPVNIRGPQGNPGKDGADGLPGADGRDGEPGKDGEDYILTEADKAEIAQDAAALVDVPDKLPNPHALTFSGAVEGSYDGSAPMTVEIPEGGGNVEIPDEQIENAVNAWLDEHPEATTTVADGSITPQKLSFYKTQKEPTTFADLDFSETITGTTAQGIGLWYGGKLSESVRVDGDFNIIDRNGAGCDGQFSQYAPVYYDQDGALIHVGNTADEDFVLVSRYSTSATVPAPFSFYHFLPPGNAVTVKWYVRDGLGDLDTKAYIDFTDLVEPKPWVSDEVDALLEQNTAVRGDIFTDYSVDYGNMIGLNKDTDYSAVDFIPSNYTEIKQGESGTQSVTLIVPLQPIEMNGHTDFYLAVKGTHGNATQLMLYGQHGLFAYDENWNPLTARSLQFTPEATDYVTAVKLLTQYPGNAHGTYYYHVTVDPAVKYLLPVVPNRSYEVKYSFKPFNPMFPKEEIKVFEAPKSVEDYINDMLRPDYYRFRQIGRLVPNGSCNYVAWNHNTLHYDVTRNRYVMTMRGANAHGGSTHRVKFVTIDPATLEATTSDVVVDGVTVDWVNGFTIDDAGKYMMVCHVNDVQHYVTSEDGGVSWTDGGEIVVDTSEATNIDTTKYTYTKFFDIHRLSTGTLLASYDDTVSPTNKNYQFVARSTDGVNWKLIEFEGGNCEMSFYEHNGMIMMIGRKNTYQYSITDHEKNESYNNAGIAYSYDDGRSWTASVSSVSVRANVQNVSVGEHDGVVELMAMNRDFNKYPRGYVYHYTATPEEALADRFTLREVFQCNAYGAGDVTGGALAFDRYGHGLFAYSDNHGVNSNYDYLHFLYGAKANTPSVCADSVASEFLPYSGKKTQELIDALNAKIDALSK